MPKRFCIEIIDGAPHGVVFEGTTQRCPPCQAKADARNEARRGTTAQRGYGAAHQAERARLVEAFVPGQPCVTCGEPIASSEEADLGHGPGQQGYRGLECRRCNRGRPNRA